jgi:hypothetical protein
MFEHQGVRVTQLARQVRGRFERLTHPMDDGRAAADDGLHGPSKPEVPAGAGVEAPGASPRNELRPGPDDGAPRTSIPPIPRAGSGENVSPFESALAGAGEEQAGEHEAPSALRDKERDETKLRPTASDWLARELSGDDVARGQQQTRQMLAEAGRDEPTAGAPDVLLDIPSVRVGEISLSVEQLHARVALHAEVANLVRLDVGADVGIGKVELEIKDVEAQALLKVRLERVADILDRTLQTIDAHPEILDNLLKPVGEAVRELGTATKGALGPGGALTETLGGVTRTAERAVAPGGALSETLGGVTRTAESALGPGGVVSQPLGEVAQTVGEALRPRDPVHSAAEATHDEEPPSRARAGPVQGLSRDPVHHASENASRDDDHHVPG